MLKSNISKLKLSSRITSVILLAASVILFTECKRTAKDEVLLGSKLQPASANFFVTNGPNGPLVVRKSSKGKNTIITTPTGSPVGSVNMASDSIFFQAQLSESVSWTLLLTGLDSGAKKVISGISDTINKSNSLWSGNATDVPFFTKGESIVAELTIMGSSVSYRDTIKITNPKNYNKMTQDGVQYLVLDDFENNGVGGSFPMSSVSVDPFDAQYVNYSTSTNNKVSGFQSFYMKGFDSNWNGYLIAKTTPLLSTPFGIIETDPNKVYFNLYVYGTGSPSATVSVELFEDEHPIPAGLFDLATDDGWIFDIMVNWKGWKLVSVPYSAFHKAPNPMSAGNGNGVKEPNLISGASLTLNSYPTAGKTVDVFVDLAVISVGGPFVP